MSEKNEVPLKVRKLMLWLNSGCNARCAMCDIWREKTGQMLSPAQIEVWVPEWQERGLRTVVMCGESLMHPDLWPIVARLKASGLSVELLSNGLLLHKHAQQVIAHCDVLRVSLDGPPDVHNRMRGLDKAYEKLANGMAALRAFSATFPIGGRCAIHLQNFRYLAATVRAAKDIGLSSFSFSATDIYNDEAFRRFGRITEDYVGGLLIAGENLEEFRDELEFFLEECAPDFESNFITDTPDFLRNQVLGYYADLADRKRRPIRCNSPWTSAVLDYDGTVRPCFPMPGYGNINDFGGLYQAMNSDAANRLRAGIDVSENQICRRCVDQTYNPPGG